MADTQESMFSDDELTDAPRSEWVPPSELPDRLGGVVGLDLETRDDGISAGKGAGWAWRGGGHVAGYSVVADNFRGYLPVGHAGGGNMDGNLVRRWLNHVLSDETQVKVGANTQYDVGWARRDGVEVRGPVYDVQWAEALIDEHKWGYALNGLARQYLNEEKNEELLRTAATAYGVDPKAELWKLPAPFVGPYGEADADLARRIWAEQEPRLREDGLWGVFEMESALIPMYVDMRWRGVRLDADRAVRLREDWRAAVAGEVAEIKRRTGVGVDLWAAASLARALDAEGIPYPRTAKTNAPSVTADLLERTDHWLCRSVSRARQLDKLASTFIDGQLLGHAHDGRVHGEFHPLRGDGGGTIGGRGSMSNPNLQQMPSRTEEGRLLRTCFLPEDGETWYCPDFSQQEPRLLVHFAYLTRQGGLPLRGSAEAREKFRSDPKTDYHQLVADITGLPRRQAKTLNLAIIYGRGAASTAEEMALSLDDAKVLIGRHREALPFATSLADVVRAAVEARGYVRTLSGRRCRFPYWEPADWKKSRGATPVPLWKAKKQWPGERLRRAWLHKVLNRLIQGSAADQTKKAMLDVWRAGLGRHVLVQVHDELDLSCPDRGTAERVAGIMRDAVRLEVPSVVDLKSGASWGEVK